MTAAEAIREMKEQAMESTENSLNDEQKAVLNYFGNDWSFLDGNNWFRQGQVAYRLFKMGLLVRRETPLSIKRQMVYSLGKGYQYRSAK